jgi:hypothetical protein
MDSTGPYESDVPNIQEVIFYCTSRLRAALIAIVNEDNPSIKGWKLDFYRNELVCPFILFIIHISNSVLEICFI